MFIKKIIIPCIILLPGFPLVATAQNNSSPYSVLGIGDLENSYYSRYIGMANSGVALSDSRYVNNSNAASLTALLPRFYSLELSGRYRNVLYSGANVIAPNNKTSDFQMRSLMLAVKLNKRWGSSIGLLPFSTSAYSFSAYKNIQGTLQNINTDYEGQGGVNQVYWSNGYRVTKNTSIGVTTSALFGSLTQTENLETGNAATSLVTTKSDYLHNYYFNFSLLTKLKLNKHWLSTYGLTFTPKTPLRSDYSVNVTDSAGNQIKTLADQYGNFNLPTTINAGIALIKDDKYTFTINAKNESWSTLNYMGQNYQLVNSNRISLGFQSSSLLKNYYNQHYEKGFFQLGVYGGNSYLKVNNQQITDFGASIGYGRNSLRNSLGWVAALEAGRFGNQDKSVLSQNYVNLTITFSFLGVFNSDKKY